MFISDLATEIAWCLESGRPDLIPTLTDDQEALAQATDWSKSGRPTGIC